ncbi:MAG: cyclic nucleotide-binding/CBS domain-containing protein [Thermoprotei archaeon]|jgi:CBS domain-containing protein
MTIRVKDLMRKDVVTVNADDNIISVAKTMKNKSVGYAIVLKDGKPIGIVTERDITWKIVAENLNPQQVAVSTIASYPIIFVDPDSDLSLAADLMERHNIRRLPVIKDNTLYGIITATDIVKHFNQYVKKAILEVIHYTIPGVL